MEVYSCGTLVKIKLSELNGYITGINIRDNRVQYGVSYFNDHAYKEIWLSEYEFEIKNGSKKNKIGFKE